MFSSGGVAFPVVDGPGEMLCAEVRFCTAARGRRRLAVGAGNGVLLDLVAGAGSAGIGWLPGRDHRSCCGWAVGCGCVGPLDAVVRIVRTPAAAAAWWSGNSSLSGLSCCNSQRWRSVSLLLVRIRRCAPVSRW